MAFFVGSGSYQLATTVAAPVTSIAGTTIVDRSLTVGGVTPDMSVYVVWPSLDAGLIISGAWCDTAGTVKLRIFNQTGSPIVPVAQTLKVIAF